MSKAEWLATLDPLAVFDNVGRNATARKVRLAAAGCCRLIWDRLVDGRSRRAVEAAECYADGLIAGTEVMEIEGDAAELVDWTNRPGGDIRVSAASCAAFSVALWAQASWGTYQVLRFSADIVGKAALIRILDCVFGIPRRHRASADPAWLTSTVIALARGIYDDRAFDRMPILADALEDAGCDNADILAHCRDADATHVRGCWVVDLILGKE